MPTLNPEHIKSVIESINKSPFFRHMSMAVAELDTGYSKVVAHGTSKLMVTRSKQTIDDVVDYVSADKLPSKFLRRSYAV